MDAAQIRKPTGLRFRTLADAQSYQKTRNPQLVVRRGMSGWRKAPFEEVILFADSFDVPTQGER